MLLLRLCVACLVVAVQASVAWGQDTLTPYFGPGSWLIGSDDARAMKDILRLTREQSSSVQDLITATRNELVVLERKHQRALVLHEQNLGVAGPFAEEGRRAYVENQDRHTAEADSVERQFLANVQLLLDAEQSARWPTFERARRRVFLRWIQPEAAGNTDLTRVVRGMTLTAEQREAIAETLEKYEHDVDTLMLEYRVVMKEQREVSLRRWKDGQDGNIDAEDFGKRITEVTDRLARVQKSYAQMLATRLPTEQGEEVLRAAEPARGWFGRLTEDGRLFELMQVRGVTDEQRAAMRAAFARGERELGKATAGLVEVVSRHEKGETQDPAAYEKASNEMQEAYAKARGTAIKAAMDVLTPEQRQGYMDGTDEAKADPDNARNGWWW